MIGSSVSSSLNVFSAFRERRTNGCSFKKERLTTSKLSLEWGFPHLTSADKIVGLFTIYVVFNTE